MAEPSAKDIGEAMALVIFEIIGTVYPNGDEANSQQEYLSGQLLDAMRQLNPSPTRDIIEAAAEILVKSEVPPFPSDQRKK